MEEVTVLGWRGTVSRREGLVAGSGGAWSYWEILTHMRKTDVLVKYSGCVRKGN